MTKDVLVKISGLQFAEDQDNGPVEIITTGNYYKKNGKHYILYDALLISYKINKLSLLESTSKLNCHDCTMI